MDVPQYDSQAYWDQRYAQDANGQFEWCVPHRTHARAHIADAHR
jgi:hypothetical protein